MSKPAKVVIAAAAVVIVIAVALKGASAQEEKQGTLNPSTAVESRTPKVFVEDLKLDKDSLDLTGGKSALNGSYRVYSKENTYVPGLMVQVELYEGSEFASLNLLDVQIGPAVFYLGPNEEKTQSFSYQLSPLLNDGKYTLRVQAVNQKGVFLGWEDKVIDIKGNNQFLEMPAETMFVILKGQENIAGLGVPFDAGETPKIKFSLTNPSENAITASPKIVVHKRRLNMEKVQELAKEAVTLAPNETKTITYDMPQLSEPESYLAVVRFYQDNQLASNMALFRWVVRGSGAEILGAKLEQDFYQKGETANVRIEYIGPSDFTSIRGAVLNVRIYDKKNNLCGEFSEDKIDLMSYSIARTAEVNISRDCLDPRVEAQITKDAKPLDKYEAKVESTSAKAKEYQEALKARQKKIIFISLAVIALIILISVVYMYFRNKKASQNLITMFLLLFAVSLGVFAFANKSYAGTAPTSISGTPTSKTTVSLSWPASASCTAPCGYQVRLNSSDSQMIYPGTNRTATATVASCSSNTFEVRACDGNVSPCGPYSPSTIVNNCPTPAAPSTPAVTNATQTSLTVSWSLPTNCPGCQYQLERTNDSKTFYPGTSTTRNDTGLTCGTNYSYRVRGCPWGDGNLCGPYSNTGNGNTSTCSSSNYSLAVSKSGTGSGTVSGTGISCGTDCSESYASGTSVTLTASPASGSTFVGWSGACSGPGSCTVTMDGNKNVGAAFNTGAVTLSSSLTANPNTLEVNEPVTVDVSVSGTPGTPFNYTLKCYDGATTSDVNYWTGTGLTIESDGTNSNQVTCTYSSPGSYTITFDVPGATLNPKTQPINVTALSITDFMADPSGGPLSIGSFTTTISGKATSAETFSIDCGNGGASPDVSGNITYPGATFSGGCTYNAEGNYTVTATVNKPGWNSVSKTLVVNVGSSTIGIGISSLNVSNLNGPSIVGDQVYPGQSINVAAQIDMSSCTNMFSRGKVTFFMGGTEIASHGFYTTESEGCLPGSDTCQHTVNNQNVPDSFYADVPLTTAGPLALTLVAEADIYVDDAWGVDATWCSIHGGTWGDLVSTNPGNECLVRGLTTSSSYDVTVKAPDAILSIAPASTGPWTPSYSSNNWITVTPGSPVYLKAETWAATHCQASGDWSGSWDTTGAPAGKCSWPGCGGCAYGTVSQTIPNVTSSKTFNLAAFNPGAPSNLTANASVLALIAGAPMAVATISKDGLNYSDSVTVTQGVATPIYLSADGSSDPDGWTNAAGGVSSFGGKCEWNSDLNQGVPTFEQTINSPASPSACNISLGSLTFNDAPGTYTYNVLRITDKLGLQSNIDTVKVTVVSGGVPGGCGNGVIEIGEACDNGIINGACPRACSLSCTVNSCPGVVNGACGPADGESTCSVPTSGLCSAGIASAVSGSGPWTWKCAGSGGGIDDDCQSFKLPNLNGSCGSADGGTFSSAPSTNLCSAGTASAVSGSGPWTWTCSGICEGINDSCSAQKSSPASDKSWKEVAP